MQTQRQARTQPNLKSSKALLSNFLALAGWKVLDRKEDAHDMVVTAEFTPPPELCVRCGVVYPNVKK
jgi:hypothetical protein